MRREALEACLAHILWLKWDLAGGGTLKCCVGATGKNDSPWDNIEYHGSNTFWVKSVAVAPSITYLLDILVILLWPICTDMMTILC